MAATAGTTTRSSSSIRPRDAELLAVELDPETERTAGGDGVVYWTVPKGNTLDSRIGKATAAARYKPLLTTRNLNTLEKLVS